ncbi:Tht1-like nuclear fusion protein-domain-containing protein [Trichophaea hybrida]|nr:Tht1-like nuclear fusion protein-domain-containing protein [Trichophaea hybrida]
MSSDLKYILFSFLILLSIPSGRGFSFLRFAVEPAPPSIQDFHSDVLADSLAKAFPSNTHQNPAYASVLMYLSSLESKPSCHRSATATLISDCNTLDISDSDLRYRYAARLAVCEFEATGIWYPPECRDHNGHRKCIKRLEERPQWWTTLSNNIQNAMVICAAVRHEVEKDSLLELHRNVTKVQERLFKVMDVSLNQMWRDQEDQKDFVGGWETLLHRVKEGLSELQLDVMTKVRMGEQTLEGALSGLLERVMEEQKTQKNEWTKMDAIFRKVAEESIDWSKKVEEAWKEADQSISLRSNEHHQQLSKTVQVVNQINTILASTTLKSAQDLNDAAKSLSTDLELAVLSTHQLASLSTLYVNLLANQDALSKSQREQETLQNRLLQSLELLEPRIEQMVSTMLSSASKVEKSLDDAENRIQSMGGIIGTNSLSLGVLAFSLVLWLGRENWRSMAGIVGFLVGISIFWHTNPQLHHILQWFRMPGYEVGREVAMGDAVSKNTTVTPQIFMTISLIGYIVLIAALMIASVVVAARIWYIKRHMVDQKLPA